MRHKSLIVAAMLYVITSTSPPVAAAEPLRVVASFSILGDFAARVGGERIELRTLVGPDSDAHVYEPRPADAMVLARADVVLVNGLFLEGFMDRLIEASQTQAEVAVLTDGADILNDPEAGHYHFVDGEAIFHTTPNDPHAWQSIGNAKICVLTVAEAFCAADAEGCETYEANAPAYAAKLDALSAEVAESIQAVPEDRRVAVVAHNAFRYFEREFGVTFLAPQGVSTESEASAADVASLIREIRDQRAAAVFGENITDTRLVERITAEAGLELGGTLYSDALSRPDGPATTYVEMIRANVETLATALAAR